MKLVIASLAAASLKESPSGAGHASLSLEKDSKIPQRFLSGRAAEPASLSRWLSGPQGQGWLTRGPWGQRGSPVHLL